MAFKRNTKWALVAAFLTVTVLSYPAYRQIRSWRASTMAEEAERMLATPETMSRAWELAHAANSLLPEDITIARTLARVYSAGDPASAHTFWQKVVDMPTATAEDRLELARAYLQAKLWDEFEAAITAQRSDSLHPQQLDYLQALAATARGNYEQALKLLATLVAEEGAPHEADALFFQLTRIFQEPEVRRAGIEHLQKIVREGGQRQENALNTLVRLPDLEVEDVNQLLDSIDRSDHESREMKLLAEELRLKLPGTTQDSVYNRASQLFQLNDPIEMATFGRWLNRHGLHDFTRRAIPEEVAIKRQDLFLILLDSMALNNRWEAIQSLLDGPRIPLEEYLIEFFRMRTYYEMGDMRLASLSWDRALVAAARDSVKLYYLAKKTHQLGLPEFEVSALHRVIESAEMRENALNDLIAVLQQQGKSSELSAALTRYRKYLPESSELENDVLYLTFLIEGPRPEGLAKARELLELNSNVLAYRMTFVLGLLKEDRSAEALNLLLELPVNWFEVRERWRLLAAVALHREGYLSDAQKLVAKISPNNLFPEEQVFLEEIN